MLRPRVAIDLFDSDQPKQGRCDRAGHKKLRTDAGQLHIELREFGEQANGKQAEHEQHPAAPYQPVRMTGYSTAHERREENQPNAVERDFRDEDRQPVEDRRRIHNTVHAGPNRAGNARKR